MARKKTVRRGRTKKKSSDDEWGENKEYKQRWRKKKKNRNKEIKNKQKGKNY